jgi:hypothetical protein
MYLKSEKTTAARLISALFFFVSATAAAQAVWTPESSADRIVVYRYR